MTDDATKEAEALRKDLRAARRSLDQLRDRLSTKRGLDPERDYAENAHRSLKNAEGHALQLAFLAREEARAS